MEKGHREVTSNDVARASAVSRFWPLFAVSRYKKRRRITFRSLFANQHK